MNELFIILLIHEGACAKLQHKACAKLQHKVTLHMRSIICWQDDGNGNGMSQFCSCSFINIIIVVMTLGMRWLLKGERSEE